MSATGRGAPRREGDYYATPEWCTRAILPHLPHVDRILEPSAGDGAIVRVLREWRPAAKIRAVELDPDRAETLRESAPDVDVIEGDFFGLTAERLGGLGGLIVGNPPFSLAFEFAQGCVALAGHSGTVALLLRLSFLASQKRSQWLRCWPCSVFVLPRRPSFTGKSTDACDYAWFVWGPGFDRTWHLLDVPPRAAR